MENRIFRTLLFAISMVGLLAIVLMSRNVFVRPALADQQTVRKGQTWEYCEVRGPFCGENCTASYVEIYRGDKVEKIDSDGEGIRPLNKLGSEGWELVEVRKLGENAVGSEYLLKRAR